MQFNRLANCKAFCIYCTFTILYINLCSPQISNASTSHTEMSPGPSGSFLERDYRIPVVRLESSSTIYVAGDYVHWLQFGGLRRYYEVHVPPQYSRKVKMPLVLVIHGGGGNPGVMRYISRMNEVADEHGFIVIYPAGTGSYKDRLLYWNSGPVRKDERFRNVDDVGFISAVIDDAESFFTVDAQRIYATGISNGGQMAYRLAAQLSTRIAAVAPVAGDRTIGQFWGPPPRPFPVIAFHGEHDTYLAYGGGGTPPHSGFEAVNRIPVMDTIKGWVSQAKGNPDKYELTKIGSATRYHFSPVSAEGEEIDFWVLADGGHTWPGGHKSKFEDRLNVGHINQDIFASELIWEFFKKHNLSH